MDPTRFDALARALTRRTERPTRRSMLRLVAGAASGALFAMRDRDQAAAACRKAGSASGLPGEPAQHGQACGRKQGSCCPGAVCLSRNGSPTGKKRHGRCYCLDGYEGAGLAGNGHCTLLIPMHCRAAEEICQEASQCCNGRSCDLITPTKRTCGNPHLCRECGSPLVTNRPACCGKTGQACETACGCCGDLNCTDGACCTAVKGVCGEGTQCCAPAAGCGLVRTTKPDGTFCRRDAELPDAPVCCVIDNQPCSDSCDCCSDLICSGGQCRTYRNPGPPPPPPCNDSSCFGERREVETTRARNNEPRRGERRKRRRQRQGRSSTA